MLQVITSEKVTDSDVAFYFVHWLTGEQKVARKYCPVLPLTMDESPK